MKSNDKMKATRGVLIAVGVASALGIFAVMANAQQSPATPAAVQQTEAAGFLSLTEISNRVTAEGLKVTELEVHDKIVEVEAVDSSNRELDLVLDRRTGEVLSREFDD